ncbi:MAG: AMP-binding protein [bacterium]|nr:AMP-binding protein [bacterium]
MTEKNFEIAMKYQTIREMVDGFDKDKLGVAAFRTKVGDSYWNISYGELQEYVKVLGNILLQMGIKKGDHIGILSENRNEWGIVYLTAVSIGAVIVPFDIFAKAEELLGIVKASDVVLIFTSNNFMDKITSIKPKIKKIRKVVCFDPHEKIYDDELNKTIGKDKGAINIKKFNEKIQDIEIQEFRSDIPYEEYEYILFNSLYNTGIKILENGVDSYSKNIVKPEDPASMIYMHGKIFAVLPHSAIILNAYGYLNTVKYPDKEGEKFISQLPLSHTYPTMFGFIVPLLTYSEVTFISSSKTKIIAQTMRETGTNCITFVPLMLEKVYKDIYSNLFKNKLFPNELFAENTDRKEFFRKALESPGGKEIIGKVIDDLGLNTIRLFLLGGAPLDKEVIEGMQLLGFTVLEGYGLTETSPVVTYNTFEKNRPGSIGIPLVNVEVKIDKPNEDGNGEVLVKGPNVMKEYYNQPEETKKVLTEDGWLHTGDIGRFDEDDFIFITGRCKDVIVSKGGKNIYPAGIEKSLLKSKYFAQVHILPRIDYEKGEYPFALIYPDFEAISGLEKESNKKFSEEEIKALVDFELKKITQKMATYKIPGGFKISNEPLKEKNLIFIFKDTEIENAPEKKEAAGVPEEKGKPKKKKTRKSISQYTKKIQDYLVKTSAEVLSVSSSEIDTEETFLELFDSAELIKISEMLEREIEIELHPTLLFEYQNIKELSEYFAIEYADKFTNYFGEEFEEDYEEEEIEEIIEVQQVAKRKPAPGDHEQIAIVGMSGIFPKSKDLDEFWAHLEAGDDCISEIPKDRFNWEDYYGNSLEEENKMSTKRAGFIDDIDKFDTLFFNISPREAELMDPQQRIFLETVYSAIEDAGCTLSSLSGTMTGLFVGVATHDYSELQDSNLREIEAYTSTGWAHSILANRISYLLNLSGPSEPIDTACASALFAIHRAVKSIQEGESEMAIAGGVNALITPKLFIAFSKAGMLAPDGKCKTFDSSANGYVRGEGSGAVFIKPLSRAIEDGNRIYAVIKSTSVNHGGYANSLTAPNPNRQAELLVTAFSNGGISPDTVTYIETHGTGTSLGDPVEINGLKKAFSELYKKFGKKQIKKNYCGLSSVKTNIGHLETAAGIAGVIKVLLSMKNKKLPATVHFKELNPYIKLDDTPFYIVDKTTPWNNLQDENGNDIPRRAGVSSFGFGGSNSHIVLEEYTNPEFNGNSYKNTSLVILFSAKDEGSLKRYAEKFIAFLQKPENKDIPLVSIAYNLLERRDHLDERLAIVASSKEELQEKLELYAQGSEDIEKFHKGNRKKRGAKAQFILDGDDGKQFLDILINEKKYGKLAQLWVFGVNIDWGFLYQSGEPYMISLPTYAFARNSYWIKKADEDVRTAKKHASAASPLPVTKVDEEKEIEKDLNELITKKVNSQKIISDEPINIDDIDSDLFLKAEEYFKRIFSKEIKLSVSQIDSKEDFETFGIDSIMIAGLLKEIEKDFGAISKQVFFEYDNISSLIRYFIENHFQTLKKILSHEDSIINTESFKKTEEYLKNLFSEALKVPIAEIDGEDNFESFGIDSLIITKLFIDLEDKFGDLPKDLFFVYNTINDLAVYLVKNYSEAPGEVSPKEETVAPKEEKSDGAKEIKIVPGKLDENALLEKTEKYLVDLLATGIGLPKDQINLTEDLETYGVDSLMIANILKQIEKDFGETSKMLFFEYTTIKELAKYFVKKHSEKIQEME